ncbi:sigma-54 interaction domain-containing protein [Silvibacterium dinghuense]|uniref:Sigma-54-dependent Fis family transcriptional regulator n=1 Tax=Silvibacterium dinghuense TaxID=1560006 RepID=A0A4Q1SHB6_9BACT|nr:sigma-54 dependent transcriptional regulator [Silvibacterium dinghuense]RXS96747.1 sigma-54-dependent Fis family transcriptional regulator [Silvibacterium dinghuense]GGG93323.1 sigma-54-dependent Fis family transcriptional regulator [Silvibacterium dinghuense]
MPSTIVLVADQQELHAPLTRRLEDQSHSVFVVKDIPEALLYLRDPACTASVVVFHMVLRRQQDAFTLTEICSFRPYLQVILLADKARGTVFDGQTPHANIRILHRSIGPQELLHVVQDAVGAADAQMGSKEEDSEVDLDAEADENGPTVFTTPFLMRVGMADVPVLLHGETGVGKEVMARRLCAYSPRANKPFLKLNCAALPSELVESELFGYEKGAFTGAAVDKPGKFEIAQGGTILLDEIGDMDIRLQAKLLQVLQDGEVQPLGSRKTVKLNVRVLAATHRDLRRAIEVGTFREDLYYRLNVVNIIIPPLRERRDEIIPLAEKLLKRHMRPGMVEPVLSEPFKELMLQYDWPGNVRELENLMRRLLVYQSEKMIFGDLERAIEHSRTKARPVLPVAVETAEPVAAAAPQVAPAIASITDLAEVARQAEAKLLLEALEHTHWNRRQAAARLNLDYKAFLYKLQKLGLVGKKDKTTVPQTV